MFKNNQHLGKFRIIELIGKGGMADVYLAEDQSLNRQVAIKVLPAHVAKDRDWIERFKHEVLSTANLHHPHIVTVYEIGEDQNHSFYVMEYLPGGDLKQKIQSGLSVFQSLQYLRQIAQSLNYAHAKGFIHRDIKPENILFDENGAAKLTDLGIAKAVNKKVSLTGTRESIGTPLYISPEQAQGLVLDGRSDLYSLGVVFFEMLTGRLPFLGDSAVELAIAHINSPVPKLPPELAEYQDFLQAMMAKTKEDRFDCAKDLIEAIDRLLSNNPFVLNDYYQQRIAQSPELHNFGGILDGIDEDQSKSHSNRLMILVLLLLGLGALAIWQKSLLHRWYLESSDWLSSVSRSNTAGAESPRGVVKIQSHPEGAQVFINGQAMGVTPFFGQAIPEGKHQLKLNHPLYQDFRAEINIQRDAIAEYQFELIKGVMDLSIDSVPSGAKIVLDGKDTGKKTPTKLVGLVLGEHQLFLHKDHLAIKHDFALLAHKDSEIRLSLQPGLMAFYPNDWVAISELYLKAEQLINLQQLSSPTGNNAEEVYLAILKANPEQDPAKAKLKELGWQHWQLAENFSRQKLLPETQTHLKHSRRLLRSEYSEEQAKKLLDQARN